MERLQQVGLNHPRVRQLLSIQNNSAPNRHKLLIAEGLWAHNLLLQNDVYVDTFFWCPEASLGDEARQRAEETARRARSAFQISTRVLERLSERDKPDGLLSMAVLPQWSYKDLRFAPDDLLVVADGMEIPGNLGTLIRTLDACGAACLVLTNRRTRLTHPKVFRASQGMVLRIPVIDFSDPQDAIEWLRSEHFDLYLAETREARMYRDYDYRGRRTAFVLGAERYGLAKAWRQPDFERIFLPMLGQSDSLNVSISAAVLMYEARAQKAGW